jgi:hypothetical protein
MRPDTVRYEGKSYQLDCERILREFLNRGGKTGFVLGTDTHEDPRWIQGESAVVYHSTQTGKGQLYVYRLEDGSTQRVSVNPAADYRYPHGEAAPC